MNNIMAEVERNDYSAHSLVNAVVLSMPFRYQGAATHPAQLSRSQTRSVIRSEEQKKP